jgi:hypothetical protein
MITRPNGPTERERSVVARKRWKRQFAQPRRVGGTRCNQAANTSSKWMTTITLFQMDDDDDDPYTFGHQPHALLSRPDLAAKHRVCRLLG